MSIQINTKSQFDSLLHQNNLCVIKFGAEWCGPCVRFAPQFERLAEENQDIDFVHVDVDEFPDIANKYNVTALPSLVFVKYGEVLAKQQGVKIDNIKMSIQHLKL